MPCSIMDFTRPTRASLLLNINHLIAHRDMVWIPIEMLMGIQELLEEAMRKARLEREKAAAEAEAKEEEEEEEEGDNACEECYETDCECEHCGECCVCGECECDEDTDDK